MITCTGTLSPQILQHWKILAEKLAYKYGEACDHWIKEEEYFNLKTIEEKQTYLDTHREIQEYIKWLPGLSTNKVQVEIKCRKCNISLGDYPECPNKFPKTTRSLKKEFIRSLNR